MVVLSVNCAESVRGEQRSFTFAVIKRLTVSATLSVRALRKCFGERVAVDEVSFAIDAGEVYGMLGPNGAGKTTSISMIAGILARDGGEITIDGMSIDAGPPARARIGIVPQSIALYLDLTARENLNFWGRMYDLSHDQLRIAVEDGLNAVGLMPRADDIVEHVLRRHAAPLEPGLRHSASAEAANPR